MNTLSDAIQKLIDETARGGALTPEAIRQFDLMRQKVETLEASNATLTQKGIDASGRADRLEKELYGIKEDFRQARELVSTLQAGKAEADKAVWIATFERERRIEMRDILKDVFRNTEVRRSIHGNVPIATSGSYLTANTSSDEVARQE